MENETTPKKAKTRKRKKRRVARDGKVARRMTTMRFPDDLLKRLDAEAAKNNCSRTEYLHFVCLQHFGMTTNFSALEKRVKQQEGTAK